jgi:hypothetical protein
VAFSYVLINNRAGDSAGPLPAQVSVAAMHTPRLQHVPMAQTKPVTQSALVLRSASPAHGVWPSPQIPVPSAVLAHTQLPPGPHAVNVPHVWPWQD